MSSLFDIGKSGLNSYRQALAVTGQNIANINTDGYKRRGATLEEVSASQSGINSAGNSPGLGVRVAEIQRAFDEFLLNKARSSTAYAEATSTFSTSIKQLEDILLPGEANLGAAIGRFFTGLQEISVTPSDLVARTVALEQAKQMSGSFNETAALVGNYMEGLRTQAGQQLGDINVLTEELASINVQLSTTGAGNNALLDSRDAVIDKLSQYVEVTVDLGNNGVATVTLGNHGNGPRLVEADRAMPLGVDIVNNKLSFILSPGAANILTSQVTNGSLAGIASAFATAADVMAEIDNLAFVLVREFNAIHNRGLNLEGEKSGDLFRAIDVQFTPNATNVGSASAEIEVTDYNSVETGRVTFTYDAKAAQWNGRDDAGNLVASGRSQLTLPGVKLTFLGQAAEFDQFVYDPVTGSAAGLALAIRRPQDFAATSPLLVSANPANAGEARIDAVATQPPSPPALPVISEVFSNSSSAVAATGFLAGGAVAVIPANAQNVDIFSLSGQSTARFTLSPDGLGDVDDISLTIRSLDSEGTQTDKIVDFNVAFSDIKGFDGKWMDFDQIADLINVGTITGVVRGSSQTVSLASLGGFASGASGNLTFSLNANDFVAAEAKIAGGQSVQGAVTASIAAASDVQIFTREGRHVAGTLQTGAELTAMEAMMTEANGFNAGAVYRPDYLNASGSAAYLGMETTATSGSEVLVQSRETATQTQVIFSALEGIDTDEASVDGLAASAATVNYSMTVGPFSAQLDRSDIAGSDGASVAAAMIQELRAQAPLATLQGTADAAPLLADSVRLSFEGQIYTLAMVDGEVRVSGGEPGRLDGFFDDQMRLNVVSSSGTIQRSAIEVLAGPGDEENLAAARRFGLMHEMTQTPTRFSGALASIAGTDDSSLDKVVTLTFDRDDTYNLDFVFGDKPEFGSGSTSDMAFTLHNLEVSGGNASAVASAINAAVSNNATDGDGGADLTSLVSATAIGNLVKLTLKNGLSAEIKPAGNDVSIRDGVVGIQSFSESSSASPATAALQFEEGKSYSFKVNGQQISFDTSLAGLRAATGGTLAGAITDAAAAIANAINLNSGSGTAAVSTALSVPGVSVSFDMTDGSGNPIVVSDFEVLTRGAVSAGSLIISQDMSSTQTVAVTDGEYLTASKLSGGTPLGVAPNKVGQLLFSDTDQYYEFSFDADADGAIGTSEVFVIDGVKKDFHAELAAVASRIEAVGGSEVRTSVSGAALQITNLRDDGVSLNFGSGQPLASDALPELTAGLAYFRPQGASDDTLENETDSIQLVAGSVGISEGGRLAAAPDATAALQLEEGKVFRFSVNGQQIEIDTTPAGLRASTGGTLAGALGDAAAAIINAVDSISGLGAGSVSTSNSVTGSTIRLDITDAMGNPVVISNFEKLSRAALAAGSLTVSQDITGTNQVLRTHGEYLTDSGQSGGTALAVADGDTGSISFSPTSQRFSFTLDTDGDGAIATAETFVIDGVKGDFAAQLAAVAGEINAVAGISAAVVGGALQITNSRGDGSALSFGIGAALASDALDAVGEGAAYFKSSLPAGTALDLDSNAVALESGAYGISSDGFMAVAADVGSFTDGYTVPAFDLRLEGDRIIVVPDDGEDMPDITTEATSLAKQRYTLGNLPGEDLIVIVGDAGARRLSVQYDMLPAIPVQPQRDIDIRVTDASIGEVEYFDVETGTSLATRRLDAEQRARALNFEVSFTGALQDDDAFLISGNRDGIGDNRNINLLLDLQGADLTGTGSGGFQRVFSATVAKLGAIVQSGEIAADAAVALRDASLEAESEFTGVNLDTEAANLIEQQQAYQASARILSTARELFDTLLQTMRG